MSYLSFLFAAQTPTSSMVNVSRAGHAAESEAFAGGERDRVSAPRESTAGDRAIDYRLPSGVVSMEHWLDLNA